MPGPGKNRDIEVLRAFAISYVIATHWVPHFLGRFGAIGPAFERYTALASGVDLFFCISGYVIARSTLAAASTDGSLGFAPPFWIRRVFRLWPSAWLWALIPFALSMVWNRSGGFGATGPAAIDAGMAVLNVENFHYYHCLRTASCGPLGVYWSLSLEEQFYWIFPFLLLVRRPLLIWILAALAALQIVLPRPNSFSSADPSLLWLIRTDAICLGILLALLERAGRGELLPSMLRTPARAGLVTLALFAVLATAAAPAWHLTRATGILAVASGALVWIARFNRDLILPRTRLDPLVLWIGSRSYSLYLIHAVAGRTASELRDRMVSLAPHAGQRLGPAIGVLLTIGLTIGLSELNFRFIETPLRLLGRRVAGSFGRSPGRRPQAVAHAGTQ